MQASIVEKTQCLLPFCASFTCLSPEKRVGLDDPNPCDIAKQPFVNLSLLCLNQLNHYDLFFQQEILGVPTLMAELKLRSVFSSICCNNSNGTSQDRF